jgi:hypothetical protein
MSDQFGQSNVGKFSGFRARQKVVSLNISVGQRQPVSGLLGI